MLITDIISLSRAVSVSCKVLVLASRQLKRAFLSRRGRESRNAPEQWRGVWICSQDLRCFCHFLLYLTSLAERCFTGERIRNPRWR
jgi:hypothetical protein